MTKKDENDVMEIESLREPMSIGKIFAESGLFPDIKSQAQAVVKILAGKELGLSPFQSMKDIYLVNGKLAIMANALAAIIKVGKKYDYKVIKITDEECQIAFYKLNGEKEELGVSTFTIKDAAKAGIVNGVNWKSWPRNMLFARSLSNGVRWYCPDSATGWHTYEEMEELLPVERKETITIDAQGNVGKVKDGEA